MKQCPQCRRTYSDDNQFCLEDGTALMFADAMASRSYSGDIPTVVVQKIPPTQHFENQPQLNTPPQFSVPQTAQTQTNSIAKWVYPVLGILLGAVMVLGLLVVFQFTKKDENASTNTNSSNKESPKPSETSSPAPTVQTTRETQNYSTVPGKYPEGSSRLLNGNDLVGKSSWDLRIMRNEIFARHGRRFKSAELRDYFMNQPWYSPQFDEVRLTEIETRNVEFLKSYE